METSAVELKGYITGLFVHPCSKSRHGVFKTNSGDVCSTKQIFHVFRRYFALLIIIHGFESITYCTDTITDSFGSTCA